MLGVLAAGDLMPATQPCALCGKPSYGRAHKTCQRDAYHARTALSDDIALTGGRWVYDRRRGVEVYVMDVAS